MSATTPSHIIGAMVKIVPSNGSQAAPFSLQEGSPAIDAGTDVGITEDIEGTSRDSQPDIGAYEKK
ncbi:MAG TPA: choice-of-anchor Q domain-containing protein [Candidatus Paceibacterota bacterium]